MRVTGPMIQRGVVAYHSCHATEVAALIEAILRAACNDPVEPPEPLAGQTRLDVVDGETVVVLDG
jgi:hypothetical protein